MQNMLKKKNENAAINKEIQQLNPEERKVFNQMIKEFSQNGSSDTLKNLWNQDYNEIPVDIDQFIDDDRYLGKSLEGTLYPYWRNVLRDIMAPDSKYVEVILTGAIGIGKSTIADVGMCYMLYKLLCMKNPQSYYGLTKSSIMTFNFFNVNLNLAGGVTYAKMQSMLRNSPWFLEHGTLAGRGENKTYVPSGNIALSIGSKASHALGQDVFCLGENTLIVTKDKIDFIKNFNNKIIQLYQADNKGNIILSNPCKVRLTKYVNDYYQIDLEDDTSIICSSEHRFKLKDGSYKMAKDLTLNDELFDIRKEV